VPEPSRTRRYRAGYDTGPINSGGGAVTVQRGDDFGVSEDTSVDYSPSALAPDDPQGFNHCFADVNGIRMHYVDEGHGPLALLLHGYPFLWYLWRHQIRALASAGYRAIALDQRGYGQSDTRAGRGVRHHPSGR
jgi:alpha/beta hydrolase fold